MKLTDVGQVIASRLIRDESTAITYLVKIGVPQRFSDSQDFYCPFQIASGRNIEKVSYTAGIDSVQALQLAMKAVGGTLARMNRECDGHLRWDGDEDGDLGFPIPG
jgi:hypothetical protein